MNDIAIWILIILIIILIVGLSFIFLRLSISSNKITGSEVLLTQIENLSDILDKKLSETNEIIRSQLNTSVEQIQKQSSSYSSLIQKINENNTKILQQLTEKLVKVEDTNNQIVNFAKQLQNIQNIFKNPKQRGIIGEYFLETILSNVLPESVYQIQYKYKNGLVVDAVIFIKDKIVPIDAKFSTDGYTRMYETGDFSERSKYEKEFIKDVKKRIDETSKYIDDQEKTIDIAFMFIPSDAVYNEIISISNSKTSQVNLISYSYSKKVVLVSPTSFFAYLQTVLLALNTIKIEGQIQQILQYLNDSTKYLKEFEENIYKLGKNIDLVIKAYNNTAISSMKLSRRIAKATNNKQNIIFVKKLSIENEEESFHQTEPDI